MKNKLTDAIGHFAAILVTAAYVPGVFSIWKLRPAPATAVSLPMYVVLNMGIVAWLIFGIRMKSRPVIFSNVITFPLSFSILIYKLIYG